MSKSRSQDIKPFRGGEREVGIPWGGGSPGGRGALKRSLGSGLLPRPSNPTPFQFVIVFKTKQFFLKLRSWRWNFFNKNLLVRQTQASFELAVIRELKRRRFWATHVDRNWGLLPFLSFFSPIKTIYLRVSTKPQPNAAKSPVPVDVRRSKTPLLKLPIFSFEERKNKTGKLIACYWFP